MCYAPVILEVDRIVPASVAVGRFVGKSAVVLLIEQEVGYAVTGIGSVQVAGVLAGVVVAATRLLRLQGREAHALEADSSLQRVVAGNLGHVVENLVHILM